MSSNRVMQCILIIKEYRTKIFYIPGPNNVIADALSKLPKIDNIKKSDIFSQIQKFIRTLVFGRDMLFNIPYIPDLENIGTKNSCQQIKIQLKKIKTY